MCDLTYIILFYEFLVPITIFFFLLNVLYYLLHKSIIQLNVQYHIQEAVEGNMAKDVFGGRLTSDYVAEKLGHALFSEVQELDFPNCGFRIVDMGNGEQFKNLRR